MVMAIFIGSVLGFLAGLGIGGGSLLMLWLTAVLGYDHSAARGINLMFFLPSALITSLFRWKQGKLPWKKIFPAMIAGCIGALVFSWLGSGMELEMMKKLFGGLLLFTGLRELTYRPRKLR